MAEVSFESEKELEDYIVEYINENNYNPVNGDDVLFLERQVDLGAYGIIDILLVNIEPDGKDEFTVTYTILELKKERIDEKTITQISRYIIGLKQFLLEKRNSHIKWRINGQVIATKVDNNNGTGFLIDIVSSIDCYLAAFDLNTGMKFTRNYNWKRESDFTSIADGLQSKIDLFLDNRDTPIISIDDNSV